MIKRANKKDLQTLAEIHTNAWHINFKGIVDDDFIQYWTIDRFMKKSNETQWIDNKEIDTFVYVENDKVKGFISGNKVFGKYDYEIRLLFVDPDFQNQNIGKKLLGFQKSKIKNQGCKNMILWTIKGLQNNIFFKNQGGEILEEIEYEYGNKKYQGIGFVYFLKKK